MAKYAALLFFILLSQTAGLVGSLFTAPAIPAWYAGLNKPAFNPPDWLFGPVWLTLYTLMGIAVWLVWQKRSGNVRVPLALGWFFFHLVLNALWSYLFFGLHKPGWAFAEIIALWLVIVIVMTQFYRIESRTAYLLLPYILWVSFAAVLNFSIWRLN